MGRPATDSDVPPSGSYQPLVVVVAALAVGCVTDRYVASQPAIAWPVAAAALVGWLFAWNRARPALGHAFLLVALTATGATWHAARWSQFSRDELGAFATHDAQPVCVRAVVARGPRRLPAPEFDPLRPISLADRTRLELQLSAVRDADRWSTASGRAQLDVDGHVLGLAAGDEVIVFGQLTAPRGPQNPGEFDFAEQMRADRRLCRLTAEHPDCVTRAARGSWWLPARWLDRLRSVGNQALGANLDRSRAGLALALVMGERDELDATTTRHFYETGTVHLLSISGLHVGLLAWVLFRGLELGWWRRGPALLAVAGITTLYALVIDAESPAIRATIMVWLACLALYRGRTVAPFNVIAAAAIVVVVLNPADLFRIGPQLSFLAVAVLAWRWPRHVFAPSADPLTRLIAATRPWPQRMATSVGRAMCASLLLTTLVWLVSMPLVLAQFHLVSPAVLILTPLLAIPVAVGLLTGFLLATLGWFIWPLSIPVGWICDASLGLVETAISVCDYPPLTHAWLPGPDWWWLIGLYGALGCWVARPQWRPPLRWCVALLAAWITVGIGVGQWQHRARGELNCTFLSVGHGCSVLLELPDGTALLYDAGRLGSPAAATRTISEFLWSRGRTHVDAVVVSHADVDHYNALPELLRRFSVGVLYVSPLMFDDPNAATETLRRAVDAAGVPLREIFAGDRLGATSGCSIEVLHPPPRGTLGSDNSNSIVLDVVYQGRRILLTGDLESPGLDDLLAESPLDCDVVLAPHHGSVRSDPPGFAAWSSPEWVVVSGDRRSTREQVANAYRSRGAHVLNTFQCGAVTTTVGSSGLHVRSWLAAPVETYADLAEDSEESAPRNTAQESPD